MNKRVYISSIGGGLEGEMLSALEWIGWKDIIREGSRVFVKPNFTFPFHKPGVTTSPGVIDALIKALSTRTSNIRVGETDGAGVAWTAEQAFEGHGLPEICARYGAGMVNLSRVERKAVEFRLRNASFSIELPAMLLEDTDVFITVPVPKIHCMTGVSLALKNQWGCIPIAANRFRYHPYFDGLVCELNRLMAPRVVIGDCTCMLTGNGPMFGEEVRMDMLAAANDLGAFEETMLRVMGVEGRDISHINEARRAGLLPGAIDGIEYNADWRRFASDRFFLRRTVQNYIALMGFRSNFMAWLGYESPLAGLFHRVLYAIKGNPLKEAIEERERHEKKAGCR